MSKLRIYGKKFFIAIFVVVMVFYSLKSCISVSDEVGFLGMDKDGRQVLIQTFDNYFPDNMQIRSDWEDYSFVERLWQEPMRTTFRVNMVMTEDEESLFYIAEGFGEHNINKNIAEFLSSPFELFIKEYTETIFMQEEYSLPIGEFKKRCRDKDIKTVKDLLAGFGFKRYQVYINDIEKVTVELPAKNIKHIGSN